MAFFINQKITICNICILQALKYICQKDDLESQGYKKWKIFAFSNFKHDMSRQVFGHVAHF